MGQTLYLVNIDRIYYLKLVDVGQTLYLNSIVRTCCLIWLDNTTTFTVKVANKIDEIHYIVFIIRIFPTLLHFIDDKFFLLFVNF